MAKDIKRSRAGRVAEARRRRAPRGAPEGGKCPECGGTGRKWFRLPDDVGSPYAVPCPRGCPMEPLEPVVFEVAPEGDAAGLPGGLAGRARPHAERPAKPAPPPRLRRVPGLLQAQIDALAEKAKAGRITPAERRDLDKALDWLDDLTIAGLTIAGLGADRLEARELRGRVTIGVPHCSNGSEFVEIRVEDGLSGALFAEVKVGLAEFTRALAARQVGCTFRLCGMDIVGMRQEHKVVEIRHPCPGDYARERDDLLREAVAPHEVDGWAGDIGDFRNSHNRAGVHRAGEEVYRVSFTRYVDPAEGTPTAAGQGKQAEVASEGMEKYRGALREMAGRAAGKKASKAGAKKYKRKCHKCGTRRATQHTNDPYLSELHPGRPNPKRFWCDRCLEESARDI